ncbi:MAG: FAD-dependent oxidoreductase [Deltaproteobacteria bacterium]|nr:FAD-dependent oxidoreductase [Deltaproteobacteria bacterium]
MGKEQELNADIAIIGAGGAGLPAAVTAAYGGASVIVFEKMAAIGGAANMAEGIFAVESNIQRRENVGLTKDQAFKLHMEYSHWRVNPSLVRVIIDRSAETIEWLMAQGAKICEPRALYPDSLRTWHTLEGYGKTITKALYEKAKEAGVQVLLKTPAKKLVLDEEGRISGVIAEDKNGNTIKANVKAVIISDGGFGNNMEMLQKYTNAGPDIIHYGGKGPNGDGIQMAWEIGAAAEGTDVLQRGMPMVRGEMGITRLNTLLSQPYLWVNQWGERFFDEGTYEFPFVGNAIAKQANQIMYIIFDDHTKKYMKEVGIDFGAGVYVPIATKLDNIDAELQRGIDKGEAYVAETIDQLASMIDINGEKLVATVEKYNGFCSKGHDDQFAKNPKFLHPVKTPEFYAIRACPTLVGTVGGIKINSKTEVLNKKDVAIPGLYASGNCAGGMYGDTYDAVTSGLTISFAVSSGRIGSENALRYIGK